MLPTTLFSDKSMALSRSSVLAACGRRQKSNQLWSISNRATTSSRWTAWQTSGTGALQSSVLIHSGSDKNLVRVANTHDVVLDGFGHNLQILATGLASLDGQAVNWANSVTTPTLSAASDNGISNSDGVTSITTPEFSR